MNGWTTELVAHGLKARYSQTNSCPKQSLRLSASYRPP
jgi:hypothetical protein